MARVTNDQLLTAIEDQRDATAKEFTQIVTLLADHDKRLSLLENHNHRSSKRLELLENRERATAMAQAKLAGVSALIGGGIAALPSLIQALSGLFK